MCFIDFILFILLFRPSENHSLSDNYFNEHYKYLIADSSKTYYFKGQMIDTVTKKQISQLCDHCAMSIRFKISDSTIESDFIDLIVFDPNYDKLKFYKGNCVYSIKAVSKYTGPRVLIVPAGRHKEEVPVYWCENISPDY
jgi:hypothetical protein